MSLLPIRYVSFNCYGTLIDFRVGDVARDRLADRVPPGRMAGFLEDFTAYRFDEVLGAWKPYPEVLHGSLGGPAGAGDRLRSRPTHNKRLRRSPSARAVPGAVAPEPVVRTGLTAGGKGSNS